MEKFAPLLKWVESEFGFKPVVYSSFFGGKQADGLVKAIENLLKKTDDCELAAIDALAAASHSLVISIGIFQGKLRIEEAIELIRLEEDFQVVLLLLTLSFHSLVLFVILKTLLFFEYFCRSTGGVLLKVVMMLMLLISGYKSHQLLYSLDFQGDLRNLYIFQYCPK